jgi:uncharacterized membrane protein YciS (DUF1049 family)
MTLLWSLGVLVGAILCFILFMIIHYLRNRRVARQERIRRHDDEEIDDKAIMARTESLSVILPQQVWRY